MPSTVAGLKLLLRTLSRSLWQTPRTALGSNWPRSCQATFAGNGKPGRPGPQAQSPQRLNRAQGQSPRSPSYRKAQERRSNELHPHSAPRAYEIRPKKDLSSGSGLRIAFSSWLRIKAAPAVQSRAIGRQSTARTACSPGNSDDNSYWFCEGKRGKRNEARGVFPTKRSPSAGATGNGKTAWLSSRLGISANPAAASVYHRATWFSLKQIDQMIDGKVK